MSDSPPVLPILRMDLDFTPSPSEEQPGLLLRDPMQFTDAVLLIPAPLVELLGFFDGQTEVSFLKGELMRVTGDLSAGLALDQMQEMLSKSGFLDDEKHHQNVQARIRAFQEAPVREAAHANGAYPADPQELDQMMNEYFAQPLPKPFAGKVRAIAAPHVSPFGGWESYRDAYDAAKRAVGDSAEDKTFVVLGTSHYGMPERFGLTRKPFQTPFGLTRTDTRLVDELASKAPKSVLMEDFVHSVEHSIEFQVIFLQRLFGANVKILPILCGPFLSSIQAGHGRPEESEEVKAFLETLGEIHAREAEKLFYVMGVDMAHVGGRYGDPWKAQADSESMQAVMERDQGRLQSMTSGDAGQFWDRIMENHDDLKWCGSAPIYSFLKACPEMRGDLLRYGQWNIDEASVVTFGALQFGLPG
jgi:MEMO1 family protein